MLYTDKTASFVGPPPSTGVIDYFVYNAVGHTVALTDPSGAVTQSSIYEAFGETVKQTGPSTNNRLRNTKERDTSIGLDNDGFRYYDPASGRYITRDPIGYGDGLNVYASVGNNPINGVDPLGLTGELVKPPFVMGPNCAKCGASPARSASGFMLNSVELRPLTPEDAIRAEHTAKFYEAAYEGRMAAESAARYTTAISILSFGGDMTPGLGNAKSFYEATSGTDPITKEQLGPVDRTFAGAGVVLPALKKLKGPLRAVARWVSNLLGKADKATEAAEGTVKNIDKVKAPERGTFVDDMSPEEAERYRAYHSQRYPGTTRQRDQVSPGIKSIKDQKISSETGEVYTRETIYDNFGRRIENNDHTVHGRPDKHTNPHHHTRDPKTGERGSGDGLHPETPGE